VSPRRILAVADAPVKWWQALVILVVSAVLDWFGRIPPPTGGP